MYRIAICDDEQPCRDQLTLFLRQFGEKHGEEFQVFTFESADRLLLNYPKDLDLLFLDIAMNGIDGMAAAHEIRRFDPHVCILFITTMHQCAIDGYGVKAFSFIKKPVSKPELDHELTCALSMLKSHQDKEQYITLRSNNAIHRLPISKIAYCEVQDHQMFLFVEGEPYHCRESMNDLENNLAPMGFFRCHNSYLVNSEHIARIEPGQIVLRNETVIPISQRRRKKFMSQILNFWGGAT